MEEPDEFATVKVPIARRIQDSPFRACGQISQLRGTILRLSEYSASFPGRKEPQPLFSEYISRTGAPVSANCRLPGD